MKLAATLFAFVTTISMFASAADFATGVLNCTSADGNTQLKVSITATNATSTYNNVEMNVTNRTEDSLTLVGELTGWDSYYYQLTVFNTGSAVLDWDENIDCLGHSFGQTPLKCTAE